MEKKKKKRSNGNKHKSTLKAVRGIYNQSKLGYCFTNFLLLPIDVSARKRERESGSECKCVRVCVYSISQIFENVSKRRSCAISKQTFANFAIKLKTLRVGHKRDTRINTHSHAHLEMHTHIRRHSALPSWGKRRCQNQLQCESQNNITRSTAISWRK